MVNARRRVLLADSSKYGLWSLFNVAPLRELTDIVTDNGLDADTIARLAREGVHLVVADTETTPENA